MRPAALPYQTDSCRLRGELIQSLHERNYFTQGTESRQNLLDVVDRTILGCSDDMVLDIHREYFRSPIIGKRIHTGLREELPAAQIHELAVLTAEIQQADNKHLINHLRALHTYTESGLIASENYALESYRTKSQCSAILSVSYSLHGFENNKFITWVATTHSKNGETSPRIQDDELIGYLIQNPETPLLLIKTIQERGGKLNLDLMREISSSAPAP